jgi:gas vesicle protein
MDEDNKKISHKIDRLVMGIILGGAIGSVLGLTLAPRKGKETRDLLKKKGQEFVRDHKEKFEGAKYQLKKGKGFFRWLFRRKAKDAPMPPVSFPQEERHES